MNWYIYDENKVFTHSVEHIKGNPVPQNSTDKEPLTLQEGEIAIS